MSLEKHNRSHGVATSVIGLSVVAIVLAAGIVYIEASPVQGSGSNVTTTQTIVSTATSTVNQGTTTTQVSTVTQTSLQNLIALAKAEGGTLTDYSIIAPDSYSNFYLPNITKVYPWMKINYVSLDPAGTITRPTTEYQAGKVVADIIEVGGLARMLVDVNNGVCAPVNMTSWLTLSGYLPGTYDKAGQWYSFAITPYVLFYNTNLLSPSQVPKTYQDLANPIYKGKIALDTPANPAGASTIFASLYPVMGNASWTQFLRNLATQSIAFEPSGGTVETVVTQGQYAIGLDTLNGPTNSIKNGLPVKIAWTNPVYMGGSGFCIAKNAPHPYTAQLYAQWETSLGGQTVISKGLGFASPIPQVTNYALTGIIPSNVTLTVTAPQTDFYTNPTKWTTIFKSIFGL